MLFGRVLTKGGKLEDIFIQGLLTINDSAIQVEALANRMTKRNIMNNEVITSVVKMTVVCCLKNM